MRRGPACPRSGMIASAAAALAAGALLLSCTSHAPGRARYSKPQSARATTRPNVVTSSPVHPATHVALVDALEESHKAATRMAWCALPGPEGKLIWVQVK